MICDDTEAIAEVLLLLIQFAKHMMHSSSPSLASLYSKTALEMSLSHFGRCSERHVKAHGDYIKIWQWQILKNDASVVQRQRLEDSQREFLIILEKYEGSLTSKIVIRKSDVTQRLRQDAKVKEAEIDFEACPCRQGLPWDQNILKFAIFFLTLAQNLVYQSRWEEAEIIASKSVDVIRKVAFRTFVDVILKELVQILLKQKKYLKAEKLLQDIWTEYKQGSHRKTRIFEIVLTRLPELLKQRGDVAQTEETHRDCIKLATKDKALKAMYKFSLFLCQIHKSSEAEYWLRSALALLIPLWPSFKDETRNIITMLLLFSEMS